MGLLATEQEALKTRAAALVLREKEYQQREKDLAQKQKQRRLLRLELMNIIESFPFLLLVFVVALFLGAYAGINIPDGVGCSPQNTLCQRFRFKLPKVDYQK
ncbi:MAG: hypothetical protein QNJ34_28095 [Xenococcaceae cyanobacterium MO_188.B29]|nr:hypothetical protein [Xenococcaceae cyanobacterium MO_188.B29]